MDDQHQALAWIARQLWENVIWPEHGDVDGVLYGLAAGAVAVIVTTTHPVEFFDSGAASNPPKDTIEWVGHVGTAYSQAVTSEQEAAALAGHLEEFPTPTTLHVLQACIATKDGHVSNTTWELELGKPLVWGEEHSQMPGTEASGELPRALLNMLVAAT